MYAPGDFKADREDMAITVVLSINGRQLNTLCFDATELERVEFDA